MNVEMLHGLTAHYPLIDADRESVGYQGLYDPLTDLFDALK